MNDLHAFHFIRPEWLLALVPLIGLALAFKYVKRQRSGWQQVLPNHLHAVLLRGPEQKREKKYQLPITMLIFVWIMTCIALAGPAWEKLPQPVYNVKYGSVLVLDMSFSMRATDVAPDRLTRARFKAIDLVNALTDGEVGMVAYSGDAFKISPLTEDVNNLISLIPSINPEIMPIPGSEPLRGFEVASELLTNAGYQSGDIYWFTDGVDRAQLQALTEFVRKSPFTFHALMVGTEDGAPIKQINGELLKDPRGAIVIPKANPSEILAITATSGGLFSRLSAGDSDIELLIEAQNLTANTNIDDEVSNTLEGDVWQDMGVYLVILILPFAAYAFRRGLIMMLVLSVLVPVDSALIGKAVAKQSDEVDTIQLPWYKRALNTQDQMGKQAYDAKAYAQAAELYDDPMWQGIAHYRNNDFEQAVAAFEQVDDPEAFYNKGNALAKLGQLDRAIEAYKQTIARQANHQRAIENKALLESLKQQQEQQQEQQSDQQQDPQDSEEQQQSPQDEQSSEQQQSPQDEQASENTEQSQQSKNQQKTSQTEQSQAPHMREEQEQEQEQEQQSQPQQSETEPEPNTQAQEAPFQPNDEPLTEEQREQMQRMQSLLRKVPDDPSFLLQRKMQLENQTRSRERAPPKNRKNW